MKVLFTDGIDKDNSLKEFDEIIALAPEACYQLDKAGIEYKIPDDYLLPNEISMEGIKDGINVDGFFNILFIPYINILRGVVYWDRFILLYLVEVKPDKIYVELKNYSTFLWRLKKKYNNERIYTI